ncbi:MAG: hypothetical protein COU34_05220 [Candidatus Magasanikbacteria bacterium CG10_big_fil_rev_8_21_14_0_10_43_9]|nr:MAG: hypothetical protein COU34_05220 [Candidatus Magasanikbacteria bacterium CG10_big_fil_rev_8_21_14_0_10_43_9]PIY92539.1 MAG: hypothetical protein COY70_02705 [Candidatus Magasanikbacteria bacterium CG_4_10_14_0_8_um_filter_42_12]
MARKRSRTVQTCSGCDKAGHNKRRCPLVEKKPKKTVQSSTVKSQQTDPSSPKTSSKKTQKKSSQSAPPVKNKQHYVPVRFGSSLPASSHIVDLSTKKTQEPSLEAIQSFREKIGTIVERQTIDFAATIRASKSMTEHAKKEEILPTPVTPSIPQKKEARPIRPKKRRPSFRVPNMRLPSVHLSLPEFRLPTVSFPSWSSRRAMPIAFAIGLLVLLPIPVFTTYQNIREDSQTVIDASTGAFVSLQESTTAALQADTGTAQRALQEALSQFATAEQFVEKDHRVLTNILSNIPILGDHITSRRAILSAGQQIALANTYVIKGLDDAEHAEDIPMTERLAIITNHLQQALPQYKEAQRSLISVNPSVLPAEQQKLYKEFLLLYSALVDDLGDMTDLSRVVYDVFGGSDFRRLLVLFQNNNEIRPTGGFIGSFAMVDTQKGEIKDITIPGGGSYDIQGQLEEYLVPPIPLQLVNGRWEFQDVNWFFDFPTTARKAEHFVESAEGTTFDGTIAVNASVIERLLRVLGPVQASEYDMLLDADTVLPTLQSYVEDGHAEDEAPKEILTAVLDQLLNAMQDIKPQQLLALLGELHAALSQKEIQVALKEPASQARLASFGWTGSIVKTVARQDYLAVVATNVQGQKSDARIVQDIEHTAEVQENGSVIEKVLVRRTHTGDPSEVHYGASNITYMRIYVPEGAVLLDAGGFTYPPEEAFHVPEEWYTEDPDLSRIEHEVGIHRNTGTRITNEFGKTSFGNWMIVPAGESQEVWVTYRLPFSVVDTRQGSQQHMLSSFLTHQPDAVSRYSLFIQKQSGVESSFRSDIRYPSTWIPKWKSDDAIRFTSSGASIETDMSTDHVYGVAFETQT